MAKRGRKKIIVTDAMVKQAELLAQRGLTREQIAWSIGVCPKTLYRLKRDNAVLEEAIDRGAAKGITAVANALFENAIGRKKEDGSFMTFPDTRAQIGFLSRRDVRWTEKHILEHSGAGGGPIQTVNLSAEQATDLIKNLGLTSMIDEDATQDQGDDDDDDQENS